MRRRPLLWLLTLSLAVGCGARAPSETTPATEGGERSEFDEAYWREATPPLELPAPGVERELDVVVTEDLREPLPQPRVHLRTSPGVLSLRQLVRQPCGARVTPALERDGSWLQLTSTAIIHDIPTDRTCDSVVRAALRLPAGEYELWVIEEDANRTRPVYQGMVTVP